MFDKYQDFFYATLCRFFVVINISAHAHLSAHVCTLPHVRMCGNFGYFYVMVRWGAEIQKICPAPTPWIASKCAKKNKKKSSKNGNMYFKNDLHIITVWERAQFCFPILYINVWCGAGADKVKWCGVGCGADFFDELWCAVRNKKILRNVVH